MNAFTEKVNLFIGGVASVLAMLFGEFWFFFAAFFVLNIADYVTGLAKAKYTTTESSGKGAKGIVKKVGYWVVIGVAFFVSVSCEELGKLVSINLSFLHIVGYFTLATYIINEIRSIIENLVVLDIKVPAILVKGLAITQKLINDKSDMIIDNIDKEKHERKD